MTSLTFVLVAELAILCVRTDLELLVLLAGLRQVLVDEAASLVLAAMSDTVDSG